MSRPPIDRIDALEGKVDGLTREIGDRIHTSESNLRIEIQQFESNLRSEIQASMSTLLTELLASDEDTRRYMRVLHEEVLDRIRTIGEGFR